MRSYKIIGVEPFLVSALDVAVLGAHGSVATLALGVDGRVRRRAVEV